MSWDIEHLKSGLDYLSNVFSEKVERLSGLRETYASFIRDLDLDMAKKTVIELFGEGEYEAVGIDGSMDYRVSLDVVTMFIAVASYHIPFKIESDGSINLDFGAVKRDREHGVFKILPFWMDDLPALSGGGDILDERSVKGSIEAVPRAIMTYSEFALALKSLEKESVKIIFLDRPIASSYAPYFKDARDVFKNGGGIFTSSGIEGIRLSKLQLYLAIYLGPHPNFLSIQPLPYYRTRYIIREMVSLALENNDLSIDVKELEARLRDLGVSGEKAIKKIMKFDLEYLDGELIEEYSLNKIYLSGSILNYWDVVEKLLAKFSNNLFKQGSAIHPLYIEGRPLTAKELHTMILLQIYRLRMLELESNKLVIGIGKDTAVTDFIRVLIPYITRDSESIESLKAPVRSDKGLFTILSSNFRELFRTPWRSMCYDNAFSTLVYKDGSLRVARKSVTLPLFLVRNYFQLREANSLGVYVRSPVFFYDRFYRDIDKDLVKRIDVEWAGGGYPIDMIYEDVGEVSILDNAILYILSKFDNPQILESAGHNYLLFIADKEVKRMINTVRNSVSSVVDNVINRSARGAGVYIITKRFREYRAEVERRRRG